MAIMIAGRGWKESPKPDCEGLKGLAPVYRAFTPLLKLSVPRSAVRDLRPVVGRATKLVSWHDGRGTETETDPEEMSFAEM